MWCMGYEEGVWMCVVCIVYRYTSCALPQAPAKRESIVVDDESEFIDGVLWIVGVCGLWGVRVAGWGVCIAR